MRLQDKGDRFIIADKQTDHEKVYKQIEKSSFLKMTTTLQHFILRK